MFLVDRTFASPEENLACDEALLDACEEDPAREVLRVWTPASRFIVLGHGSRIRDDVRMDAAHERSVPILRRYSGGGTVVQGPGCLNYALVLTIPDEGPLTTITGTTTHIMNRNARALQALTPLPISLSGLSDLAINGRKFSGNAQRRARRTVLFHGTILLDIDLDMMEEVLLLPVRQPEYRRNRSHSAFLRTFPATAAAIIRVLATEWEATLPLQQIPESAIRRLAESRYHSQDWTLRR